MEQTDKRPSAKAAVEKAGYDIDIYGTGHEEDTLDNLVKLIMKEDGGTRRIIVRLVEYLDSLPS